MGCYPRACHPSPVSCPPAIALPASHPVVHAAWKLKPPVTPSSSSSHSSSFTGLAGWVATMARPTLRAMALRRDREVSSGETNQLTRRVR